MTDHQTTVGETREELMQYYEGLLEEQEREIAHLRAELAAAHRITGEMAGLLRKVENHGA